MGGFGDEQPACTRDLTPLSIKTLVKLPGDRTCDLAY